MNDDIVNSDSEEAELDQLLATLRELAARTDPVPISALTAARAAFFRHTMDAELIQLAKLTQAGRADLDRLVLVRGNESPEVLTFEAPGLTVELEVTTTGRTRRLVGQVLPPQLATVDLLRADGSTVTTTDDAGCFVIYDVAPGPASLRCQADDDESTLTINTDWFVL